MDSRPIAKAWRSYKANVLPSNAGPVQIEETQRAFYSGAVVVLSAMADIGEPEVTEEAGIGMIETMAAEMRDWFAQLEAEVER